MVRRIVLGFLILSAAFACTDDPVAPGTNGDAAVTRADSGIHADAAPADTGLHPMDAAPADTGIHADAEPVDVGPASEDAAEPADTGPVNEDAAEPTDTGPTPLDATPLPYDGGDRCEFLDLEISIVNCGNRHAYLRGWQDVNQDPNCLPYWTLEGGTYTSSAAAIAGAGCSDQCNYRASISVSFIDHCGRRNGYIVFADANNPAACPDLYEFSTGLYPSREAWERDTLCPDAGP